MDFYITIQDIKLQKVGKVVIPASVTKFTHFNMVSGLTQSHSLLHIMSQYTSRGENPRGISN